MAQATCSGILCSGPLTNQVSADAPNNRPHTSLEVVSASSSGLTVGIAMSQMSSVIRGNNTLLNRKCISTLPAVQGLPPFPRQNLKRRVTAAAAGRAKQQSQAVPRAESTTLTIAAAAVEPVQYTVLQGDTLWALAERFDTSIDALLALNGITDPDLVLESSVLLVPSPREAQGDVSSTAAGGGGEEAVGREMASSVEASSEGLRGSQQWSAGQEVRHQPRFRTPSATTAGMVVASLLALGVILLAINTAVRRLMRGQRQPYVERKRNTERIALTKSRFRAALSIDRSTRPAGARAMRGEIEGGAGVLPPSTVRERQGGGLQRGVGAVAAYDANGVDVEESTTDTGVDLTAEVAMANVRRDREEAWAMYGGGMEQSYESFLRDCGARKAGRFQGGMPSKFKDRTKR